jgi:hypothetical protein
VRLPAQSPLAFALDALALYDDAVPADGVDEVCVHFDLDERWPYVMLYAHEGLCPTVFSVAEAVVDRYAERFAAELAQ